jgi:hypothetical protein
MKKYVVSGFTTVLTFVLFLGGCKNQGQIENAAAIDPNQKYFGEQTEETGAVSYDSMLTLIAGTDSLEIKVEGKVSAVCQAKGCWMDIVSEKDSTLESMFVQFKDYAFFMPKDLAGKKVVISGKAYREITSVDDLKHFAEDEGKTPEEIAKITEPREELKFMAAGVKILD